MASPSDLIRMPAPPQALRGSPQERRRFLRASIRVFYLAASNLSAPEIADLTGMTLKRVQWVLSSERAEREIMSLAFAIGGGDAEKAFRRLLPETIAVQASIMRDKTVKASTRLEASKVLQDRALGKAAQKIDVSHKSSVRLLIDRLNEQAGGRQRLEPGQDPFEDIDAEWMELKPRDALSGPAAPAGEGDISQWTDLDV